MARFEILNEAGEVENTIIAPLSFVEGKYTSFREVEEPVIGPIKTKEEEEIEWRNSELYRTDSLILLSDYPYKEQLTVYRQALRDWPATPDFPDTRPELGV
jgi:hypothetical protein